MVGEHWHIGHSKIMMAVLQRKSLGSTITVSCDVDHLVLLR